MTDKLEQHERQVREDLAHELDALIREVSERDYRVPFSEGRRDVLGALEDARDFLLARA